MANTQLSVSTTSSGTRTKWTASFWVKRSNIGNENTIFGSYLDNDNKDKIAAQEDRSANFNILDAEKHFMNLYNEDPDDAKTAWALKSTAD